MNENVTSGGAFKQHTTSASEDEIILMRDDLILIIFCIPAEKHHIHLQIPSQIFPDYHSRQHWRYRSLSGLWIPEARLLFPCAYGENKEGSLRPEGIWRQQQRRQIYMRMSRQHKIHLILRLLLGHSKMRRKHPSCGMDFSSLTH